MDKISAVIITFNEEKKLDACLASLKDVVDEIVVVDSFSTDATEAICRSHGVQFFQQAWKGYGAQKNDAATRASFDYILSIDADETISPQLKQSILDARSKGLSGVYQMNRLNNFYGYDLRHGNTYPDTMKRLYNRKQVQWSLRAVHETLEIDGSVAAHQLKGDLLHRSKDSIADHLAGINKYSTLSAEVYFEAGKKGALVKMLFSPFFTFLKGYIVRMGFLDGYAGLIVAKMYAHEVFLKYSKLLLLQKHKK